MHFHFTSLKSELILRISSPCRLISLMICNRRKILAFYDNDFATSLTLTNFQSTGKMQDSCAACGRIFGDFQMENCLLKIKWLIIIIMFIAVIYGIYRMSYRISSLMSKYTFWLISQTILCTQKDKNLVYIGGLWTISCK